MARKAEGDPGACTAERDLPHQRDWQAPADPRSVGELDEYMTAMRVDCGPVRIDTAADLDRYMLGIAGPVGRIMAPLLGCPEDRREIGRAHV